MNLFSLTLFDEKKKHQAEDDMSAEAKNASESGAKTQTGEKQDASAAGEPQEKEESFEELIKGKYKEAFTKKVQEIINRRFKAAKETEEKLKAMEEQKGASVDEAYVHALEEQLAMLQMQAQRAEGARRAREAYEGWAKDMEGMQKDYPDFAIAEELKNPQYAQLLKSGMGLRGAYEALHLDKIKEQIAQKAREEAQENYRMRAERPDENGASGGGALRFMRDVSRLSKEERREIAKRAARGEKIKF